MMVKPAPTTPFEVAQSELLLQILVVALDAPTHLRGIHEALQGRLVWKC
jgi:hypothetical protein